MLWWHRGAWRPDRPGRRGERSWGFLQYVRHAEDASGKVQLRPMIPGGGGWLNRLAASAHEINQPLGAIPSNAGPPKCSWTPDQRPLVNCGKCWRIFAETTWGPAKGSVKTRTREMQSLDLNEAGGRARSRLLAARGATAAPGRVRGAWLRLTA